MTRIIAGSAKGKTLKIPPRGTRPTSSRVREAVFSHIESAYGLTNMRVADICAGSGALALEALSRGSAQAVLIDNDPAVAKILRQNIGACGFTKQAKVLPINATAALEQLRQDFDLVFFDPPYDFKQEQLTTVLQTLTKRLAQDAVVVLERSKRNRDTDWPQELAQYQEKTYGDTVVQYARYTSK